MSETTVTWLEGGPARAATEESSDQLDPRPVVLWTGDRPEAVVGYRVKMGMFGMKFSRSFERFDRGPRGPFPLETTTLQKPGQEPKLEGPHPGFVITADVDGDGTDELVLPTFRGGVEVAGARKAEPGYPGPGADASVARYVPIGTQVARLGTGAVVHVLFDRDVDGEPDGEKLRKAGAEQPYLLVRVDRTGAKRVVLGEPGFPFRAVLAVGAVSRPGSSRVDELVVLSRKDEGGDLYLSRHRPDGPALEPARKVYVPIKRGAAWAFTFVPQSRTTILASRGTPELHFVEAEKPVNWVHRVDLEGIAGGSSDISLLGVADVPTTPKALVNVGTGVWAVDAEGRYYTASSAGLVSAKGADPLYRMEPPDPGLVAIDLVPSANGDDAWLAVWTREAKPRALTHEEIAEAADRYLLPEKVTKERTRAVPALTGRDAVRDGFIEEERKKKSIDAPLASVEEWRRLLPESYARTEEDRRATLDSRLQTDLTIALKYPEMLTADFYKDPKGAQAFLAALTLPAETALTLCRRGVAVRTLRVERPLVPLEFGDLGVRVISWRDGPSGITAVAAFMVPGGRKPTFAYAVVTAPAVR